MFRNFFFAALAIVLSAGTMTGTTAILDAQVVTSA